MMKRLVQTLTMVVVLLVCTASGVSLGGAQGDPARPVASAASQRPAPAANAVLTAEMCTAARLSGTIPVTAIGEPVAAVTLAEPVWQTEAGTAPAYCRVDGSMAPVSAGPTARPIQFRVLLPASWNHRAAQLGGGGMNGVIPNLAGNDNTTGAPLLARGFVTFGSDSGHQAGGPPRGGAPAAASPAVNTTSDWAVNDEAIRNLGYMQMKKTRDAAMVIVERGYGARPQFTYYFGTSQGGREALTVAQRYPADYDAIVANVPIVSFSSLMLGPHLIRIEEKPAARWVPRAKIAAIRAEFLRQCDGLDALTDGIINNYQACRAIFDVSMGAPGRRPWAARRCAGGVDPAPADTTAAACLTDGQIATLEFTYRRYPFKAPLAFGVQSFGMWVPTTDPGGSGLLVDMRFRGQEGAAENAPVHSHLGVLGVTGFLMRDLGRQSPRLRRGGRAGRAPGRDFSLARRDQSRPVRVSRPRRQDDRHRGHRRLPRVVRRAARLLPIGDRSDGPRGRRDVRAVLRAAASQPRAARHDRDHRRQWSGHRGHADSNDLRSAVADSRLGRAKCRAADVGHRHSR